MSIQNESNEFKQALLGVLSKISRSPEEVIKGFEALLGPVYILNNQRKQAHFGADAEQTQGQQNDNPHKPRPGRK